MGRPMDYCPYYCEENIWRLLGRPEYQGQPCWALFVFGKAGRAAVFRQRTGRGPWALALWDYHVVALLSGRAFGRDGLHILDFDSQLGWPVPARDWVDASLVPPKAFPYELGDAAPLVRLLPAAEFTRRFYSDRSHMKNPDGSWQAPPPDWEHPAGCAQARDNWRLADMIDPCKEEPGALTDAKGLMAILDVL